MRDYLVATARAELALREAVGRAACVRAVIDWIRHLFDEHRQQLGGTSSQPMTSLAAE